MVCGEPAALRAESEHAASQRELPPDVPSAEGDTAEQVPIVVPLSVKATLPVRLVVPEGAVMTALKAIGVAWLTTPEVAVADMFMVIGAVPTPWLIDELVMGEKLLALSV